MEKRKRIIGSMMILLFLAACVLPVSAGANKKLYFEESHGTMMWNPVRGSDGNWFMSFTNMVPGGEYEDNLQIENGSKKSYRLYLQIIPEEQDERKNQLLEKIAMSVSMDSKSLYQGTASGKEYEKGNLQNAIYLGMYEPGNHSQIAVQLELDKDIGIEWCDILTKNAWKFMVTEVGKENRKPQVIQPPKTGDSSNMTVWITGIIVAVLGIVLLKTGKNKRKC